MDSLVTKIETDASIAAAHVSKRLIPPAARPPSRSSKVTVRYTNGGSVAAATTALTLSAEELFPTIEIETTLHNPIEDVVASLCDKYPLIAIDNEIFGEPRLANHRFGVSDVLSALCVYGSFADVIAKHGDRYSVEELKDAVRFARDFLDSFYTSYEDDAR